MGLIVLAAGFLLGSIPFGLLLTRAARTGDIRAIGSGSIGATNVLRTGRRDLAAATLLLDLLKGLAAVALARWLAPGWEGWAGMAAVLGHTLTPWLGFRGGKGVATGLGVLFGIAWPLGVAAAAVWIAMLAAFRISSLAAMTACAAAVLAGLLVHPYPWPVPVIVLWIVFCHRANIARLRAGTEPRIGR